MPLTHDFKETIRARAQREPKFRQALLREAVESYLTGDLETGKSVLRDYVNASRILEQEGELIAGELLIVDDDGRQGHSVSLRGAIESISSAC